LSRTVAIVDNGRDGSVTYRGPSGTVEGYWEFGGEDVVAIVSMGSRDDWRRFGDDALADRAAILRFVADETIRQRAPTCEAQIDEQTGVILLRQSDRPRARAVSPSKTAQEKASNFVRRYRDLRAMFAGFVAVAVAVIGGLMWLGKNAATVAPATGVPLNECVRFEGQTAFQAGGIACLIQKTDPHLPNWTGRGGGETASVAIALFPADGAQPLTIPVVSGLSPTAISLARVLGSDGYTLWFDVAGLQGVRLVDGMLVGPKDLRAANPALDPSWWEDQRGMDVTGGKLHVMRPDRSAAVDIAPETLIASASAPNPPKNRMGRSSLDDYLALGLIVDGEMWLAVLSAGEMERSYARGKWIRPVENAEAGKIARRLTVAQLEPSAKGDRFKIKSIAVVNGQEFMNAAFLRANGQAEPVRLSGPGGTLMIATSEPGPRGTLTISRVDVQGNLIWSHDTALDRFNLRQILPDPSHVAFVGTRAPIPDKLSEPLLVLIDAQTGRLTTHSLWR
jgi:hypothetical protein